MLTYDDERLVIGCRRMLGLVDALVDNRDEPFVVFLAVASQTDDLPLTVSPELLDAAYRERCVAKAREYSTLVKNEIHASCQEVIRRWKDA